MFSSRISKIIIISIATLLGLFYALTPNKSVAIYGRPIKLGENINNSNLKDNIKYLGLSEGNRHSDSFYYHNYNKGLEFRFKPTGELTTIFLYTKPSETIKSYWDIDTLKYTGEVPITGIKATDTRGDIEQKLGLPTMPTKLESLANYLINDIEVTFEYNNKTRPQKPTDELEVIIFTLPDNHK